MKKKVLLLEPNYQNKYPPMGLMKLATYYRTRGDDVRFFKGDIKDFASTLLCEEYMKEINDLNLASHWSKFFQYIKNNKKTFIESIGNFENTENAEILKLYRKRFTSENYPKFDIICISTLFTFHWKLTIDTINNAKAFLKNKGNILVGGIASSILPNDIFNETGVHPIVGLMNKPGLLNKDNKIIIDKLPLDYSILEETDYKYPTSDAYFAYTTRGCPNSCPFCAVPKLEPKYCDYLGIKTHLKRTDYYFGAKKDLLLMDNNVFASKHFNKIIDEIKKSGFEKGSTYIPPNEYEIAFNNITAAKKENRNIRAYTKKIITIFDSITDKLPTETEKGKFYNARKELGLLYPTYATRKSILEFDPIARPLYEKYFRFSKRSRYIDFNQGLDVRLITEEKMKKLSEINIRPLRIAFDQYTPKMVSLYKNAIKLAAKYRLTDLSNYLLYNYNDRPEDLYERLKINIDLCEEFGVTIYSFPMKYHPVDDPQYFHNRDYIGKHWNRKFIRSIQAVLNSTKGKIGRGKSFFEEAFGKNIDEFRKILWMPETFIIYRRKYDKNLRERLKNRYTEHYKDENNLTNEWWKKFTSLDENRLAKLKEIVCHNHFSEEDYIVDDPKICDLLSYYKIKRD
jgi:hypothetical protein